MKQKIFSLLVLMITTVSSAWALPAEPTYDVVLTMTNNSVTPVVVKTGGDNAAEISTQSKSFSSNEILALVQEAYATTFPAENYTISLLSIVSVSSGSAFGSNADGITIGPFDNGTNGYLSEPIYFQVSFIVAPKPGYIPTIVIDDSYSAPLRVDVYHNQHSFDGSEDEWSTNTTLATHHWHDCNNVYGGCKGGVESYLDKEVHVYDSNSDLPCVCTKCGHLNHDPAPLYTQTDDAHYYACINPGCPLNSTSLTESAFTDAEKSLLKFGYHIDEDPVDGICDECEYAMNAQVDDHIHDFTSQGVNVYDYNDNYHWLVCQITNPVCPLDYTAIAAYTEANNSDDDLLIQGLVEWAEHNYNQADNTKCVCGKTKPAPVHEHSFSTDWTITETHHYHKCIDEDCPLYSDELTADDVENLTDQEKTGLAFAPHAEGDTKDGNCDVCEYHIHFFSADWTRTATHHYHKCIDETCAFYSDNLTADFVGGLNLTLQESIAIAAHSDTEPEDGICDVCGYVMPAHTHTFSEDWIQTETHHFHPCTTSADCPLASAHGLNNPTENTAFFDAWGALDNPQLNAFDFANHYDELSPEDGICDVCGYEMTPAHVHVAGTAYKKIDGDYHFTPCTVEGCDYGPESDVSADDFTDAAVAAALHFEGHGVDYLNVCPKCFYHGQHQPHATDYVQKEGYHYKKCITPGCLYNSDNLTAADFSDDVTAELFDYGQHSFEGNVCSVCGYEKHIHHFADEWTKTAEGHYHKCLLQGCNLTATDYKEGTNMTETEKTAVAYAGHTFDTNDVCTTCGYDKNAAHVHVFGDTWYEMTVGGKDYHYKKCTAADCPINYESMSDLEKAITSYGQHQYGTSQEGAAYYTCKVCGKVNTDRQAIQHKHSYQWVSIASTGETDAFEHWEECVATEGACTAPKVYPAENKKKHKFAAEATDYTYYTCSICSYIDENRKAHAPHVHVFAEAWSNNETHHYHECIGTQGECTLKYDGTDNEALEKYEEHTYGASQEGAKYYTCQTCGYINTTRKNADHSHDYGDWKHDNLQHWKECTAADNGTELAGPCTAPKGWLGNHEYASVDDAATTDKDERALCSVCGWYNEARKQAIDNAAEAANVQSWCWDYEIPFNFEAPVQNDRRFNADQCYTIFLPYALELNGLKAYAIEQHNDNIVGFKEQAVTELPQLTPFVVKSETTGNPLSSAMTTVYATLLEADQADWMTADEKSALLPDRGYAATQSSIHNADVRLHMLGTLRYLVGNEANDRYIMQGKDAKHPNGVFKLIAGTTSDNAGYDKVDNRACILPMRAYIEMLGGGWDARQVLTVVFYDADGAATAIETLALDEDGAAIIYDLQGRRVQNPRKGGLYIIGGRKVMYK